MHDGLPAYNKYKRSIFVSQPVVLLFKNPTFNVDTVEPLNNGHIGSMDLVFVERLNLLRGVACGWVVKSQAHSEPTQVAAKLAKLFDFLLVSRCHLVTNCQNLTVVLPVVSVSALRGYMTIVQLTVVWGHVLCPLSRI